MFLPSTHSILSIMPNKRPHQFTFHAASAPALSQALTRLQMDPTRNLSGVIVQLLEPAMRRSYPDLFQEQKPASQKPSGYKPEPPSAKQSATWRPIK
jgi:hypothetical protein